MDILSGSYAMHGVKPMSGYFQVLWGEEGGKFGKPVPLKGKDGKPLVIEGGEDVQRICTRPTAVDWDADGDLDLLVGNFEGSFYLFKGEGKGVFDGKSMPVEVDGQHLKNNGHHSDPYCVDLDGDGDVDVVSGSSQGGVQWAENVAGPGKEISLKPFVWLIDPSEDSTMWSDAMSTGPGSSTRVYADDVNGDGKIDLLVGDSVTVYSPQDGVDKKKAMAKFEEMQKARTALMQQGSGSDGDRQEWMKKYTQIQNELSKFVQTSRTGHVWLYLGK